MGTRLIARGLRLGESLPCLWSLDHPDAVAAIHAEDVAAGAEAVVTNSFLATDDVLARFGREADLAAVVDASVHLARSAVGGAGIVLGDLAPPADLRAIEPTLATAISLLSRGVDALLLETCRIEAAAAFLRAARDRLRAPILISLCEPTAPENWLALRDLGADVIGLNCMPLPKLCAALLEIPEEIDLPRIARPSRSAPDVDPVPWSDRIRPLLDANVRIIGGCCGTDDGDTRAAREAVRGRCSGFPDGRPAL